jgi:hypothetical protein
METKSPHRIRWRTDQIVAVRLVYVEPSENERAVAERMWATLLGEPDNKTLGMSVMSLEGKPA